MPAISSTGVGSGLDVNSIITPLMALERKPLQLLQTRASAIQTKISAFGALKGQLSAFADVATRLSDPANWNPLRADSSDAAAVSATAASGAVAGRYSLEVQQLAQSQSLASGPYAASTTVVGTGTLSLEVGTTVGGVFTPQSGTSPVAIAIDTGNQTLAGVRDAINAAAAGVNASIVTSGGTSQLVLRGVDGAENSIRLTTVDDDGNATDTSGLSALAWDPAAPVGAGRNLSQTQAAQNAAFTLNGLALQSASNSPTGVLEGVSLNLKKVTTSAVNLTVSVETMAVRKNVNDFVNAYNSLNTLLQNQTRADPSGANRGALQADSTATSVLSALRDMLHGTVTGSAIANLSDAGIQLQRDGSLSVIDGRLTPLLETPDKLAALFSQAQTGEDTTTRGFGVRLKTWADALTAATGTLASRTDGLEQSVKTNQRQQDAQQDKLTRTEARLRAQYQRLDGDMARLNAQLSQLTSSLGLNNIK